MVLGQLPVPGRPTIWRIVGHGPTALAVGAGGGCLNVFTLLYLFSPLSPSLWETARYRLKYCLKGLLNPKQPTNQPWYIDPIFKGNSQFTKVDFIAKIEILLEQMHWCSSDLSRSIIVTGLRHVKILVTLIPFSRS